MLGVRKGGGNEKEPCKYTGGAQHWLADPEIKIADGTQKMWVQGARQTLSIEHVPLDLGVMS